MAVCKLCHLKKTTRWYISTPTYAVLDCPVCGKVMIMMKQHKQETGQQKTAKSIVEKMFNKKFEIYVPDCFDTEHPYFHATEKSKKVVKEHADSFAGDTFNPPY